MYISPVFLVPCQLVLAIRGPYYMTVTKHFYIRREKLKNM